MSLLRLLAAGKSLVGLKESENRYRLTSQRLLPKFESKKNPFGSGVSSQPEPVGDPDPNPPSEAAVAAEPPGQPAAPASEAPAGESKPEGSPKTEGLWSRARHWCGSRIGSLFLLRRALPAPATARRQLQKRLFQAELSLEAVRVVRNDLSDSDVEIVTCNKAAVPKEKTSEAGAEPEGASRAWNKVTDTLFGGTKR